MAEDGSRIPAWRRLGLALKNEIQSGVAAPEPSVAQSEPQRNSPYDGHNGSQDHHQVSIEPAVNEKLGKRKHQHEPADEAGQTAKRGKTSTTETHSIESIANDAPFVAEVAAVNVQTALAEPSTSEAPQPKGDPNYRKKKAKPNKNKRRIQEDVKVAPPPAPVQTETNHDRSSLSPGPAVPNKGRRTLLASTELDNQPLARASTPQRHRETSKDSNNSSSSPTRFDRRKSVTFTPDTKRVDGSSAQDMFKKWVADQKGDAAFSAAIADFVPVTLPPGAFQEPTKIDKDEREETEPKASVSKISKSNNSTGAVPQDKPAPATETPNSTSKGKKKDPSIYVSYLTQYHIDRDHWKFNKAKQNDVIDNALNIFRIPAEHSEALLEYVQGLKGAGVIERLSDKCEATLKDLNEQDANAMDDPAARQAMQEEAMKARISQEQKRRKVEGDVENLLTHPHGDGYIRRLRRERAEALLLALGRTAPILPASHTNGINPMLKNVAPARDSKKRKRRSDVSSDESSSDSSSDDSSSSDSDSDSEDSKDSSSSSSEAEADSDNAGGAGSASSSKSGSESEDDSDSD
jgi:hypothetical protein